MKNSNIFVILVGPSGVGKSTLIREIIAQSTDFEYVKPYMTRPLREGETEKISISAEEFSKMEQNGDFLVVNEHYGYKYGTPKTTILKIQSERRVPILDYQLSTIQNLYNPAYTLLNIYIRPQTIQEWEDRLEASEQFDESRLILGKAELERVLNNEKINSIDHIVINRNSELTQTAAEIRKIITNHLENSETNSNKLTLESYETGYNEYIQNAPSNRGGAIEQWIDKSLDGLSTEASILEIGSAYGRDARIIEEKGFSVEKTDAALSFVEFLHQNDPTAYALNILTDDVPKDYDLIIANAVFLHFTDDEAQRALTKAFNALKSGGTLAITLKEGAGESWQENKGMKARYFNYWSKEDITNLIVSTGFTTVDVWLSPSGDSSVNWIMITAKK